MGLLNLQRVLGSCCYVTTGRWVKNLLFAASLMLLWFYLVMIGAVLDRSRRDDFKISIGTGRLCRALVASDSAVMVNVLVFFLPAIVTLLVWAANLVREKTSQPIPRTQLQLDTETEQNSRASLTLLSASTLLSCLLPFPAFVITTTLATGGCSSAQCLHWVVPMSTVAEWVLFAKAGLLPIVWILSDDYKMALLGAIHHFRRVPTNDTRDLVDAEVRGEDDTPFSEI
ncbi:hypothetical protein BaRGS_00005388 [Batillaria attramentaria]|uniref:G-protein coupled receptors family 1 profile domain-containing protein n=1 Tax=Batillaria attramentaria TaxID=370345 RepID=A0ABD0LVS6_9CAEN